MGTFFKKGAGLPQLVMNYYDKLKFLLTLSLQARETWNTSYNDQNNQKFTALMALVILQINLFLWEMATLPQTHLNPNFLENKKMLNQ